MEKKMLYVTQQSILTNRFIFEQIVNHTKVLHNKIFGIEHRITLKNVLKELYMIHKNSKEGSYEKQHYTTIINEMCDYVNVKYNVNKTKIYETWLKFVFEGGMEVDNEIITYLKEFIFGDVQTYQIIFEHNDKKTNKGRYYYVIKLQFNTNTNNTKMFVSIQDLNNDYSHPERGLSMITNSSPIDDGFIEFDVSTETLLDLAKYTYYEFNNCGFNGGFQLYPHVSLVNNNKVEKYVNDYIGTSQFNNIFLDLLVPF